jgi:dipeptidyl aminopeptidase/acylaminoacyl peptidase
MPGGVGSGWLGSAVGIFYRPQFGFLNSSVIVAIDFANLTLAALPAPGPGAMNNPVWSPDQGQIAFLLTENNAESGAIYVADVSGLNARQVGAGAATLEDSLLWTPDGEWLVYSDPNGGLWRVRPDGSQQEQIGTYPVEEGLPLLVAAPTPSGWPLYYRMRPLEFFNGGSPVYVLPEPHAQAIYLTTATYGPIFAGNGQSAAFALLEGEYPTIQSSVYFLPANPAYFEP